MSRFVLGTLIEVTVIDGVPLLVDDAMWVRHTRLGRGYLDGNPHTFRSGVGVWWVEQGFGALTSLDDITECSDAARAWIAGYLHGNEPDIDEYLGWDGDYTDDEWRRWRALLDRYHATGWCPTFELRPTQPLPVTAEIRRQASALGWEPWCYAGERVWVQRGATWNEADPQPEVDGWGKLVGSVCARRATHSSIDVAPDEWDVCSDCGRVTRLQIE